MGGGSGHQAAAALAPEVTHGLLSEEAVEHFFEHGITLINYCSGLLLLLASAVSILNVVLFLLNKTLDTKFRLVAGFTEGAKTTPVQLTRVRFELGSVISFALTLLVAVDVLDTLLKPTHKHEMATLYKLAIIASVRTGLAYFLGKEVKECEEELHHVDGAHLTV